MTNQYEMTDKLGFEIKTCGRCGGSGRHSFNQINGDVCFGCGGSGKAFTSRGREARRVYIESLSVPLSEIRVGDMMEVSDIGRRYFAYVVSIEDDYGLKTPLPDGTMKVHHALRVTTQHEKYGDSGIVASPSTVTRKGWNEHEKADKLAAALVYQDSLTKAGKPRKTK